MNREVDLFTSSKLFRRIATVTAAFLLMSSAALAGADPVPVAPAAPAPAVVNSGAGCNKCAPCGCEKKPGLLDRLKEKFGKKSGDCCAPVPACAPVKVPLPCNTCGSSAADRPNLLDKLKSRWSSKHSNCGPTCCTAGAPIIQPGTGTAPKEMPKPKDVKPKSDDKPKAGTSGSIPLPLPPVNGAGGLTGSGSPY